MDSLESLLFLQPELFMIDWNTALIRHAIGLDWRSLALICETLFSVLLLGHPNLLTLPEREWLLSLAGDLNRVLLDHHPSLFFLVH